MKRTVFFCRVLLIFFAIGSSLTACRRQPRAQPDHPQRVPGAAMQDVTFYSAALNRQMTYRVFLPATILPGQKLPVVYLLHGQGDAYTAWSNNTEVAGYAAPAGSAGLILVMPGCGSSYYMNSASIPQDRYEDFMVHDLIADVETRFPAAANRENRAIIGISMGGFAAMKLALSHPDLYAFAGSISGAIDVARRRFSFRHFPQWWRFRTIFGPMGSRSRLSSDPFLLIQAADPHRTPYLYLTAGEQEPLLEPNRRFAARLNELHFPFEFHTRPGFHDWNEWNAQIPACFDALQHHLAPAH